MVTAKRANETSVVQGADRRSGGRQVAVLRAALIDICGKTHFCRIVNVSARGLEIRLYRAAKRGDKVSLRLASDHCISGTVAWSRGNCAGIQLDETLDLSSFGQGGLSDPRRRRRMPRTSIDGSVTLIVGHVSYPASLCDISPAGARIRLSLSLPSCGPVMLRLPGLAAIAARICWLERAEAGLKFNVPLEMQLLESWLGSSESKLCGAVVD